MHTGPHVFSGNTSQTEGPSRLRSLGWHGMAWHRMHGTLFPSMESMPCLAFPCMSASLAHVSVSMRTCVHARHRIMYVDAPMPCSSQHNEKRRARLAGMAADGIYLQTDAVSLASPRLARLAMHTYVHTYDVSTIKHCKHQKAEYHVMKFQKKPEAGVTHKRREAHTE